jgi:hypothetical protein
LVSITACQPLALIFSSGVMYWPPALLTRASMRPWACTASVTMALTPSSLRMSQTWKLARPPSSAISMAVACSFSGLRPTSTTMAPRRASSCAVQRPMPEPPPVTITTRPANRPSRNADL